MQTMLNAYTKGQCNMLTTQTVFNQLTGEGIVQALTEVMAQNFEDFVQEQISTNRQ